MAQSGGANLVSPSNQSPKALLIAWEMSKRRLRSNTKDLVVDVVTKKTKRSGKRSTFKEWEEQLLHRYPIPSDLKLPQSFLDHHIPEFGKGLEYIISKDPSLYPLIVFKPFEQFDISVKPRSTDMEHFGGLCRTIIGQQVSGASAKSIEFKFKSHYGGVLPTPQQVLDATVEELRECGISNRKSEYIKSIAQKFHSGEINAKFLQDASDEDILKKLVEIKGIGEWSAKMTMVFGLHRWDVFAHDDLGVARAMSRYLEGRPQLLSMAKKEVDLSNFKKRSTFDDKKKRDWKVIHDAYVQYIADIFKPHRTAFMLVMWRASSTDIDVLST